MSKDPAILFYTSDFLHGIEYMTMEERGQYITLLCNQHQSGHIPLGHMLNICKSNESLVFAKFTKDEKGLYYNERLDVEINKRKSYCASRANNKKGINQHTKQTELIGHTTKHMKGHMVNVNVNENRIVNATEINKFIKPTIEEIKDYCLEIKSTINAEQFLDYYDSNGWQVGKVKMKDWKATIRNWQRKQKPKQQEQTKQPLTVEQLAIETKKLIASNGGVYD